MSKIVDILNKYNEFSPQDMTALDVYFSGLGTDQRTLRAQSSSRGQGYIINTGNVEVTWESGISLFHPQTGKQSIWLDPDGDALFGWQVTKPADTALAIFSNEQTYNGDTYGKGDLLIGDPSKSNVWWDWSAGELYFRYGDTVGVTLDSTGIVAVLGKIGGWNIGSTTLYDDNSSITLDSANELIQVGSGTPYIEIDGANAWLGTSNFLADTRGWRINDDGSAEFLDVKLRGKLQASVFEYKTVSAVGGDLIISVDAGRTYSNFTTPGGLSQSIVGGVDLENHEDGTAVAAVNDICYIKHWDGTYYSPCWFTVTAVSADQGGYRNYTATLNSGAIQTTFPAGVGVVNFGTSTDGFIKMSAGAQGATDAYIQLGRTSTAPWAGGYVGIQLEADGDAFFGSDVSAAATTSLAIFSTAQTYNSESMGAGDALFGDNSSSKANMLWDQSTGQLKFRAGTTANLWMGTDGALYAGGGNVWINGDGIAIVEGSASSNAIDWYNSAKTQVIGAIWSEDVLTAHRTTLVCYGSAVNDNAEILLGSWADAGDSATITLDAGASNNNTITMYSESHAYWTTRSGYKLKTSFLPIFGNSSGSGSDIDYMYFYRPGSLTLMGSIGFNEDTWFRINQNEAKNIYSPRYFYGASGLKAGSSGGTPTANTIHYGASGGLKPKANSTEYTVWGMRTQGETTAGAWEGKTGAFGPSKVDLSAVFGYPAGVKSVLARVITKSSTTHPETTNYMTAGQSTSSYGNCSTYSIGSNWFGSNTSWIDCDSNGDIGVRIVASGTQTSYLRLYGYAF